MLYVRNKLTSRLTECLALLDLHVSRVYKNDHKTKWLFCSAEDLITVILEKKSYSYKTTVKFMKRIRKKSKGCGETGRMSISL